MHTNLCVLINGNRDVEFLECDYFLVQRSLKLTSAKNPCKNILSTFANQLRQTCIPHDLFYGNKVDTGRNSCKIDASIVWPILELYIFFLISGHCGLKTFILDCHTKLHSSKLKFIYSETATKFCEIFTLLLTLCTVIKR